MSKRATTRQFEFIDARAMDLPAADQLKLIDLLTAFIRGRRGRPADDQHAPGGAA